MCLLQIFFILSEPRRYKFKSPLPPFLKGGVLPIGVTFPAAKREINQRFLNG